MRTTSNKGSTVIRIPKDLDERLTDLAKRTGRSKIYYANQALATYLEDREDYLDAVQALKEAKGKHIKYEDLLDDLGLEPQLPAYRRQTVRQAQQGRASKNSGVSRKPGTGRKSSPARRTA